nr:MAG TPA: methyltransferase-like protein [Caudoviricetes sp.]
MNEKAFYTTSVCSGDFLIFCILTKSLYNLRYRIFVSL